MLIRIRGCEAHWITCAVIAFGTLFLVSGLVPAGPSVVFPADTEHAPGTV